MFLAPTFLHSGSTWSKVSPLGIIAYLISLLLARPLCRIGQLNGVGYLELASVGNGDSRNQLVATH